MKTMKHDLKQEFKEIATEIVNSKKTESQWTEIESDDMFQKGNYVGGFDAIEMEFVFGYTESGQEKTFQLTLEQINKVADGTMTQVALDEI